MDQQQERTEMIAQAVQAELSRRNLSLNAFSQRYGFDRNTFTRFANGGRVTLEFVERWARTMGLDVNHWRELCGFPRTDTPRDHYHQRLGELLDLCAELGVEPMLADFYGGETGQVQTHADADRVADDLVRDQIQAYPEQAERFRALLRCES